MFKTIQVFNSATTPSTSTPVPVFSKFLPIVIFRSKHHIFCFQGFSKPFNIYVHTDSLEGSSSPAEANNRWKLFQNKNFKNCLQLLSIFLLQGILFELRATTLHFVLGITIDPSFHCAVLLLVICKYCKYIVTCWKYCVNDETKASKTKKVWYCDKNYLFCANVLSTGGLKYESCKRAELKRIQPSVQLAVYLKELWVNFIRQKL